jgi:hypothetical protein
MDLKMNKLNLKRRYLLIQILMFALILVLVIFWIYWPNYHLKSLPKLPQNATNIQTNYHEIAHKHWLFINESTQLYIYFIGTLCLAINLFVTIWAFVKRIYSKWYTYIYIIFLLFFLLFLTLITIVEYSSVNSIYHDGFIELFDIRF